MQTSANGWHLNLSCHSHKLLVCLAGAMRDKLRGPRMRTPYEGAEAIFIWPEVREKAILPAPTE